MFSWFNSLSWDGLFFSFLEGSERLRRGGGVLLNKQTPKKKERMAEQTGCLTTILNKKGAEWFLTKDTQGEMHLE